MTTPVTGAGATTAAASTSSKDSAVGFDKDMFMKLLVAQLKFQNPMQPTDSSAYMQQMAVFAQVEKLGQLVDTQKAAQATQQRLSAEALVGMQVTGSTGDAQITGTVTSVQLDGTAPVLTLADGSTLDLSTITKVEKAPSTT